MYTLGKKHSRITSSAVFDIKWRNIEGKKIHYVVNINVEWVNELGIKTGGGCYDVVHLFNVASEGLSLCEVFDKFNNRKVWRQNTAYIFETNQFQTSTIFIYSS